MNLTILLFNNRIYGLTKGQYSPTSEVGKVTKSTPMGSLDYPFNPVSLALGAEATFVGRALDSDRKGLTEVLRAAAAQHRGAALVEILQDCPIFNDGSFDALRKEGAEERLINVSHGEPITFGADGEYCVVKSGFGLEVAKTADVSADEIVVHDAHGRRSGVRVRAVAAVRAEPRAHGDGHLPSGQQADLRRCGTHSRSRRRVKPSRTTRPHCSRCFAARTPGPSTNLTDVTPLVPPLAAVVLAGGASGRMGRDKANLRYEGTTLVERAVSTREPAVFARVRDRRVRRQRVIRIRVLAIRQSINGAVQTARRRQHKLPHPPRAALLQQVQRPRHIRLEINPRVRHALPHPRPRRQVHHPRTRPSPPSPTTPFSAPRSRISIL